MINKFKEFLKLMTFDTFLIILGFIAIQVIFILFGLYFEIGLMVMFLPTVIVLSIYFLGRIWATFHGWFMRINNFK